MENHRICWKIPILVAVNCGVCKEEKEARGTAAGSEQKLNNNTALLRDYLKAQAIRQVSISLDFQLTS